MHSASFLCTFFTYPLYSSYKKHTRQRFQVFVYSFRHDFSLLKKYAALYLFPFFFHYYFLCVYISGVQRCWECCCQIALYEQKQLIMLFSRNEELNAIDILNVWLMDVYFFSVWSMCWMCIIIPIEPYTPLRIDDFIFRYFCTALIVHWLLDCVSHGSFIRW